MKNFIEKYCFYDYDGRNYMSMKGFPFEDLPNTAAFVCGHVLNGEKPILRVSHDEDGYWQ